MTAPVASRQLVIAHDVGQVGDLLGAQDRSERIQVRPTIDEAAAAVTDRRGGVR